ncbi:hypothetical protein [Legionella sainthelensi]|nr:hypothetical protein [Legionella sainthelensi]
MWRFKIEESSAIERVLKYGSADEVKMILNDLAVFITFIKIGQKTW